MSDIGWLMPDPHGCESGEAAKRHVISAAERSKDPGLFKEAVAIYNRVCDTFSGMPDEFLGPAVRFVENFQQNLVFLNGGADSLDYVRECVRRSFGISQLVSFELSPGNKMRWISEEQIECMAVELVEAGFQIPPNHNRGR